MTVQVKNALARIPALVDYDTVPAGQPQVACDIAGRKQQVTEGQRLGGAYLSDTGHVLARDHERMSRSNWTNVTECDDVIVLKQHLCAHLSRHDVAE